MEPPDAETVPLLGPVFAVQPELPPELLPLLLPPLPLPELLEAPDELELVPEDEPDEPELPPEEEPPPELLPPVPPSSPAPNPLLSGLPPQAKPTANPVIVATTNSFLMAPDLCDKRAGTVKRVRAATRADGPSHVKIPGPMSLRGRAGEGRRRPSRSSRAQRAAFTKSCASRARRAHVALPLRTVSHSFMRRPCPGSNGSPCPSATS